MPTAKAPFDPKVEILSQLYEKECATQELTFPVIVSLNTEMSK